MNPVGIVGSAGANPLTRLDPPLATSELTSLRPSSAPTGAPTDAFGALLDNLVSTVDAKQAAASAQANQVLLGDSTQLHTSVIAMQEASVAFSLMVQVRNKLVESYQELMRMQV